MPQGLGGGVGLLLTSLGLAATDAVKSGGLDLLGIAAVITAVSGLIATVGALIIGFRKKESDPNAARLAEALNRLADKEQGK